MDPPTLAVVHFAEPDWPAHPGFAENPRISRDLRRSDLPGTLAESGTGKNSPDIVLLPEADVGYACVRSKNSAKIQAE
jgi:hypothetical protein